MGLFFVLLIIGFGVLVIGSIMGMTASGRITKLEQQNKNLNARLKKLESSGGMAADLAPSSPKLEPRPKPIRKPIPEMGLQPPRLAAATAAPVRAEPVKAAPEKMSSKLKDWTSDWTQTSEGRKPNAPEKPSRNLEELIGGQWSVWVGGFALLVGAVLLIRFSIEAGFFGPGARILMAAVLGGSLLAAGEWLKRSDDKMLKGKLGQGQLGSAAKALQENASVPGLLSAVGIFTLLGTTYAAHELYGFISAPVAILLLGIISLGAMALSLRQGPLLAGIGLLASFATPLLIQTETPSFIALVGYLLIIGVAALGLARKTDWRWLETGVVFGWLFWAGMSLAAASGGQLPLWSAFLALGFGVTVWLSANETDGPDNSVQVSDLSLQPILAVVWGAVAAVLIVYVVATLHTRAEGMPIPAIALSAGSILVLGGIAAVMRRQSGHLLTAGLLAIVFGVYKGSDIQVIIFAVAGLGIVLLSLREAFSRDIHPIAKQPDIFWPVFAIGIALLGLIGSEVFNPADWRDEIYSGWAFGYAALFAAAAVSFHSKSRPKLITACLTLGAGLAWATGADYGVDGLAFSVAVSSGAALMVAAIAVLRLPGARAALLGLAGLVFAHALLVQFPDASSLSERPIFNALWVYLALPTAILVAAGYLLHSRDAESKTTDTKQDNFINGVIEAGALAGLALFAVFQIRHLSNGGSVYSGTIGFAELGLQVSIGLCFTLAGLSKRFSGNLVLTKMAEVISYATLVIFAIGSLFGLSPFFNASEAVTGNLVFNSLTTGMLVPTALLGLCAWRARERRPDFYVNLLGGLALAGAISWVTAMIRYIFNGSTIEIYTAKFGDLELWTISAVWLAFGIGLLVLGVWRRERALRIASGILIILTVLKAFLIDMAGLEGVLRALSFVVLGLVLIVIGRAYQRYWLSDMSKADKSQADKFQADKSLDAVEIDEAE